jgi:putative transposase
MTLPTRKQIRLPDYDYSQNGAYFVTICTRNKEHLLWDTAVGTAIGRPHLSQYGIITETAINNLPGIYPTVNVAKYVIMPNHIHLIVMLSGDGGRPMAVPTISRVINQYKGHVSKQAGFSLWQSRFYEHVIRNEQDYLDTWQYIDGNPAKWTGDEYF